MQDNSIDFDTPVDVEATDNLMVVRLDTEGNPTAGGYYTVSDLAAYIATLLA